MFPSFQWFNPTFATVVHPKACSSSGCFWEMTPLRSAWDRQRFLQMLIEGKQRYIKKKHCKTRTRKWTWSSFASVYHDHVVNSTCVSLAPHSIGNMDTHGSESLPPNWIAKKKSQLSLELEKIQWTSIWHLASQDSEWQYSDDPLAPKGRVEYANGNGKSRSSSISWKIIELWGKAWGIVNMG